MLSAFIPLAKLCFASYFSGIGRTKVVMICDVLGMMMNVPLSYILIFGKFGLPAMGIAGAAYGTIISGAFALLLFMLFYLEKSNKESFDISNSFRYDRQIMTRFIRLGLPSGLEMFINVAAFNLFLLMFQSYGIAEAAAASIVFNWDILAFVPMLGLNIAVISLIGRFVGANDMARTNEVIAAGFVVSLSYTGILAFVFIVYRVPLVQIFISPGKDYQAILDLTSFMMLGLATYVMADAVRLVSSAVLRGAGDTRWLMASSAILYWTMLLAQYLIIKVYNFGPKASWIAFVIMIFSVTLVCLLRLQGGKWRTPEKLNKVMQES
ncbi:MAG: MATE family efflux transporter [Gammaproteobacteria bacterium]|nr:MATE family efflux transporter [Gammaproteobacteria bacterium]